MRILLDTNILLRRVQPNHPDHPVAVASIKKLLESNWEFFIAAQVIYEFLVVATKPAAENGLGLSHETAVETLRTIVFGVKVLCDSEAVVMELVQLVVKYQVTGKKIHDARLAAIATVAGIENILTCNERDFKRFTSIKAISPHELIKST